ncbi:MAG: type II toxin-antitoxin system HicA family toxin [Acidobacteriota bacterium]
MTAYLGAATRHARYKILQDDGTLCGEIPGFQGVWANNRTLEACREALEQALEDWILIRVSDGIIFCLRRLGFQGPFTCGRRQYMARSVVRLILPNPHQADIGRELLAKIVRQAGIAREDWERLWPPPGLPHGQRAQRLVYGGSARSSDSARFRCCCPRWPKQYPGSRLQRRLRSRRP